MNKTLHMHNGKAIIMFPQRKIDQPASSESIQDIYSKGLHKLVSEAHNLAESFDLEARDVIVDMLYTQFGDELMAKIGLQ